LTITRAETRFMYGARTMSMPSRFLSEIEGIDAHSARREPRAFADDYGLNYRKNGHNYTGKTEEDGRGKRDWGTDDGERGAGGRWNRYSDDYEGGGRRRFGSWDGDGGELRERAPKPPRYGPAPVVRAADIAPRDFSALKAGMSVEHPKFGRGEILAVSGGLAEIRFTAAGKKTLSLAFAPLTVIES
jgi:hypothetical protein